MASPLERICVSTWSFHLLFEQPGKIEALDFPEMVADRFGVHAVEIVFPHLSSTDPGYLKELRERLGKARSRVANVPVDYRELWEKPSISSTDREQRDRAIGLYQQGIDVAAALGSPHARCDPGLVNLDDPSITIDSYRTLEAYGEGKAVSILVENHGSIARHPEVLEGILQASGAGALPDIGNFPDEATRERGLRLLFPLAKGICHAKVSARFDLGKYVRMAEDAGFRGVYSVEAGDREDPFRAVHEIVDSLAALL